MCLFKITPNLHYLCHVGLELRSFLKAGSESLNPAQFSCPNDEDFIGRSSRIYRLVHPTKSSLRTMQRWLVLVPNNCFGLTFSWGFVAKLGENLFMLCCMFGCRFGEPTRDARSDVNGKRWVSENIIIGILRPWLEAKLKGMLEVNLEPNVQDSEYQDSK